MAKSSTVAELKAQLKARGVSVPVGARKAELETLIAAPPAVKEKPMTAAELKAQLKARGVAVPAGAKKADLLRLLAGRVEPSAFELAYEERRARLIAENTKALLDECDAPTPELLEKFETFRRTRLYAEDRLVYTNDVLLSKIKTDSLVRAFFIKDPVKQNLGENTQVDVIRRIVPDFSKGVAVALENNTLQFNVSARGVGATKTMDGYSDALKRYYILKYTTRAGGAQDNQFKDVVAFMRQCVGYLQASPGAQESFEFVLDGSFYTDKKRNQLKSMIPAGLVGSLIVSSCA